MEKGAGHGVRGQGALSPVAPRQRLSEQKALSPRGLQNVSPHSEMPDVLSGLFRHHTLLNLSDYTRLCASAQPVPDSTISQQPPIPQPSGRERPLKSHADLLRQETSIS